jgi:hypothetical protein
MPILLFETGYMLAEVGWKVELTGLIGEIPNQVFRENLPKAGDIEDVFLRIERSELATQLRQSVDDLRGCAAHARIKGGEKTCRPASENGDVLYLVH